MSEQRSRWQRKGAWDGIAIPGRTGATSGAPGLTVTPRHDVSLAYVIGAEGDEKLASRFMTRFKLELPQTPRVVSGSMLDLVWAGPAQWLAASIRPVMPAELTAELGQLAAVTDQTDARAVLKLHGPRVRDVLAKGCPVDLHPRAFRRGDTALTTIGGIGTQIWWADVDEAFHLAVPRSMAGSFWSWLVPSAQEFGVEILPAKNG
ncbi:sarcosine oxidase subunit gamma [Pseudorhodoplanes sp.]|uniref:sarcosine oxidase subunit gamma n=1 Tax=Pseudorhodoplanes sp. TaxID=1934341 RepID=UPI002CE29396|nr:sarcosine oxidase subunit gamma family protein [Pseudorhodoplanes sp.]HWV42924.1 sarcosine oxidase subunit gamma family protein [Pseudorhodoplanes sp.]